MFVTIHIWSVEAFDNSKSANCTCANFLMPGNKCLKPYRETHIVIPEQESIEHPSTVRFAAGVTTQVCFL